LTETNILLDQQRPMQKTISFLWGNLMNVINAILDFSKIGIGGVWIAGEKEDFNLYGTAS